MTWVARRLAIAAYPSAVCELLDPRDPGVAALLNDVRGPELPG